MLADRTQEQIELPQVRSAVLWNRNYLLRYRSRLLKSSGSGADFWQVTVPAPGHKKQIKKKLEKILPFYIVNFYFKNKLKYKFKKIYQFYQIYCKMWMKKMLNEGNQKQIFISSSGSGTVIITVPLPLVKKLRFLRFRLRFHNTAGEWAHLMLVLPAWTASSKSVSPRRKGTTPSSSACRMSTGHLIAGSHLNRHLYYSQTNG